MGLFKKKMVGIEIRIPLCAEGFCNTGRKLKTVFFCTTVAGGILLAVVPIGIILFIAGLLGLGLTDGTIAFSHKNNRHRAILRG